MGLAKMFTAGWVSGRRPKTGRRARARALSAAGFRRRWIGEGTPGSAVVNPSLGGGARRRSALQCHRQSGREVTLTKGGTMAASSLSFAADNGDYEIETYDDIKKKRGPRGRWWRRIAAFSLLLSASLAAITVMCVAVAGNTNGNHGGGD
jgi:hypothetical protein